MTVYRITLAKYAEELYAPGTAGRWNSQGRFVIYTAGSVSLACLENLVHTNALQLQADYSVVYIEVPESVTIEVVALNRLTAGWEQQLTLTREIGNEWLSVQNSCVLKLPSAIIHGEHNFLLNPGHPDFSKIVIRETMPFRFDKRLKS